MNMREEKKYDIRYLLIIPFCLLSYLAGYGQFEGKITYEVTYASEDPSLSSLADHFPKVSELYINGQNSRFQQMVSGGGQQIFISNTEAEKSILVMRFLGECFKVVFTKQNIEQLEENLSFKVEHTSATKEILGITCQKAISVVGGDTLVVYYNTELFNGNMLPQFKDLQGLVLEYETIQDGLHTSFKAKELKPEEVAMDWFEVSDVIREISFEVFAKNFAYKKES